MNGVVDEEHADRLPPASRAVRPAGSGFAGRVGFQSDIGLRRATNEDAILVWTQELHTAIAVRDLGLFLLADGMGGQERGEEASLRAIEAAGRHLLEQVALPLLDAGEGPAPAPSINEALEDAYARANARVLNEVPGGATTLTVVLLFGRRAYVGHVGDTRLYLVRGGRLERLTRDHSILARLAELGQADASGGAEWAGDARRNALYRAIGQPGHVEVDVLTQSLEAGDGLLLCTDGLWSELDEETMARTVLQAETPAAACADLVAAANARGGPDNISVIVIYPII